MDKVQKKRRLVS